MRNIAPDTDLDHVSVDRRGHFAGFPLIDADQCVKCGLCLPHCPTYKLSRHEGDSPRGRIALMQGLAQGQLLPEGSALAHLDGCLVCRACEPVCPAQVPYGRLIDAGREGLWRAGHRPDLSWKILAFWRRTPARLQWLASIIRGLHRSGLADLFAKLPLGRLSRASQFIRNTGRTPDRTMSASKEMHDRPALFLGCIARSLDADTLNGAVNVLHAMGFAVDVPAAQVCCGAMDAHAGDTATLERLASANIAAFSAGGAPVISTASGCGVQLQDYGGIDLPGAASFASKVHDVMHFIGAHAERLPPLRHAPARVVVHVPCTLKNGMREAGGLDVLQRIGGLVVEPLRYHDCCGAAGSYLVEHPETADALGRRLLDALGEEIPDIFATGNIGCALHIRRLAREQGLRMKVVHPVELVAASLAPRHVL